MRKPDRKTSSKSQREATTRKTRKIRVTTKDKNNKINDKRKKQE